MNTPLHQLIVSIHIRSFGLLTAATGLALISAEKMPAQTVLQTVTYEENASWKVINFDPTHLVPGSALDFSPFLDAPAGKYGPVITQDGVFKFSGAPTRAIKFYGVNLSAEVNFMNSGDTDWQAHMELMADNLAAAGYNVVRIHHHDWYVAPVAGDPTLNTTKFTRLRYLLSCLKRRGIYYTIELYSGRYFQNSQVPGMTDAPGETADGKFRREAIPLMLISDALLDNIATFGVNLLTTPGTVSSGATAYATIPLKDDPALLSVEFINEGNWFAWYESFPTTVQPLVDQAFRDSWVPSQHGGQAVPTKPSAAWDIEISKWLVGREAHRYQYLKDRLTLAGVNKPFMDMGFRTNKAGALNRRVHDYVDIHSYWAMPDYLGAGQSAPYRQNGRDPVQGRLVVPLESGTNRLFGKPFSVGEFDILSPHPRRVFMGPLMAAVAGLQDWSAIYRYAYGHQAEEVMGEHATLRLETAAEPAVMLSERIASMLFSQGEVVKAPDAIKVPYVITTDHLSALLTPSGGPKFPAVYYELGSFCQIGMIVYDPASPPDLSAYPCVVVPNSMPLPPGFPTAKTIKDHNATMWAEVAAKLPGYTLNREQSLSSTGQILTDITEANSLTPDAPSFKIVTPRSETFLFTGVGPSSGTGTMVSVSHVTTAGVCFVGSLDGADLAHSQRQLVLYLTDTKNSGTVIDFMSDNGIILQDNGDLPHLGLQGQATFTIKTPGVSTLPEIWILGYDGQRQKAIAPVATIDGFTFTVPAITSPDAYFAYEINWPFSQDFSSSSTVGSYTSLTAPSKGQFHDLSAESSVSWSIDAGALKLSHPGAASNNGAGFTRLGGAAGADYVAQVDFKLSVGDLINTSTDIGVLDVGFIDTVTNYNTATPDANVTNRLTIGGNLESYRLKLNGGTSPSYAAGTTVPVSWMLNQSGATTSYLGLDSRSQTLASGKSDVWIGGALVFDDVARPPSFLSSEVGGFRFRTPPPGSNQSSKYFLKFDDFTVYDTLPAVPLFAQDFEDAAGISSYANSTTPTLRQFHDLSAEPDAGSITSTGGKLTMVRNAGASNVNGMGFTRLSAPTMPPLNVAQYQFKISGASSVNTTTPLAVFDIGNIASVTDYNTAMTATSLTGQLTITGPSSGAKTLICLKSGSAISGTYPAGSELNVSWMLNQSGANQTYLGPDSLTHTLATNTSDVWVNGQLIFAALPRPSGATGTRLDGFRFRLPGPSINATTATTFTIDDITSFDSLP